MHISRAILVQTEKHAGEVGEVDVAESIRVDGVYVVAVKQDGAAVGHLDALDGAAVEDVGVVVAVEDVHAVLVKTRHILDVREIFAVAR